MRLDKRHPRYESLRQRAALVNGYEEGVTALAGLIAHGRGEAYDYILGEKTIPPARKAIKAASALLILASKPVISVNGNTAVLCPRGLVELADACDAKLEVNLFHRSRERANKIEAILKRHGAKEVLGTEPEKEIPGIASERRWAANDGIYSGDTVLVPLEDGDRAEALVEAGKKVIAIDLNPFSRTAKAANITIVDNVVRAVPLLIKEAGNLKKKDLGELRKLVSTFDNDKNLKDIAAYINKALG
jgi:4-phosphopantoate--beta-alanine ligase